MAIAAGERRFILVTGLSGAGKSVVLNALADLGYYCMDNLPAGMLAQFCDRLGQGADGLPDEVAVGIDARNPVAALASLPSLLEQLRRSGSTPEVVFLEAEDDVLVRRFSETRRRHPLSSPGISLAEAMESERNLLAPLAAIADVRLDTSRSSVHDLRHLVHDRIARRETRSLSLLVTSFGFKYGVPRDVDFIFDVRCLPNPYWQPELRNLSGRDPAVTRFLAGDARTMEMLEDLQGFLARWIPCFEAEQRSYLGIALGCTGGQHRSVYMTERLAERLGSTTRQVQIRHRDLE